MAYNSEPPIPLRDVEHWGVEMGGMYMLRDPFAVPPIDTSDLLDTGAPPKPFRNHPSLREGFDVLAAADSVLPGLCVQTIYSDASGPEAFDVTRQDERLMLPEILETADLVLYGLRRSIGRLRAEGITRDKVGRLVDPDGTLYQAEYLESLQSRVRPGTPVLGYDYPTTGPSMTTATDVLAKMAGAVEEVYLADPFGEEPDGILADLQLSNVKQWHDLSTISRMVYDLTYDKSPHERKVAIVAPAEDRDLTRKFQVTGASALGVLILRPELTDTNAHRYDAAILAHGYVPAYWGLFPS